MSLLLSTVSDPYPLHISLSSNESGLETYNIKQTTRHHKYYLPFPSCDDNTVTQCYATAGKHLPLLLHDNNRESIAKTMRVETGC
jgi:hypothetical protein